MVTISPSINANETLRMDDNIVLFASDLVANSTNFSWTSDGLFTHPADVDIHGTGFTYSGSGNDRELASGTISRISIDLLNDCGSETHGDLVVTGTENLIAANIDKDDPNSFWSEVLKGNDVFLLAGFGAVSTGQGPVHIIGDDFASAVSSQPGIITD